MSVRRLHELLREQARDGKITAAEVQALIDETVREGVVTPAERFTLTAALEAHKEAFTLDAWKALVSFLGDHSA
jgi:hypothetical protein